jgi:hypothetical protein
MSSERFAQRGIPHLPKAQPLEVLNVDRRELGHALRKAPVSYGSGVGYVSRVRSAVVYAKA